MKTRHAFLCLMVFVGLASMTDAVQAQTKREVPQKVETPIKVTQNAEWYKTQERLWKAEIDKNPKNEEAWANYYGAVRYRSWCESMPDIDKQLDAIVEKMEKAIPDTYTYYVIRFYNNNNPYDNPGMAKAIKMRPDAVDDYPTFVSYLMQTGDEETMRDILTRWYNSGTYSPTLLNYAYNELIGLAPNAIIFAQGDTQTFSKLILQYGKGIRPDVTIVNTSFWLFTPHYREHMEKKLGLPSFAERVDNGTYTLDNTDVEKVKDLKILSSSDISGVYAVSTKNGRQIFITGHSEYDADTLNNEYLRDLSQGKPIHVPENYFPCDDPSQPPMVSWRAHANLLYSNWLNYFVYQSTPYDIKNV